MTSSWYPTWYATCTYYLSLDFASILYSYYHTLLIIFTINFSVPITDPIPRFVRSLAHTLFRSVTHLFVKRLYIFLKQRTEENSALRGTGCSLNIVFFSEFLKIFRTLAFLCFPSVFVCVHTPGR